MPRAQTVKVETDPTKIMAQLLADYERKRNWNPVTALPEPTYALHVGQLVEVGSLTDVRVEQIHHGGKVVIVSHLDDNARSATRGQRKYHLAEWWDVIPLESITDTSFYREPMIRMYTTRSIGEALANVRDGYGYNPSPAYQRDYVWTDANRQALYTSIFNGQDIGRIVVLRYEDDARLEILDGKQRGDAIYGFLRGKYTYNDMRWHQLSRNDRRKFEDHQVTWAQLNGDTMTEADKIRVFLEVNTAGVPQDPTHLNRLKARLAELTGK